MKSRVTWLLTSAKHLTPVASRAEEKVCVNPMERNCPRQFGSIIMEIEKQTSKYGLHWSANLMCQYESIGFRLNCFHSPPPPPRLSLRRQLPINPPTFTVHREPGLFLIDAMLIARQCKTDVENVSDKFKIKSDRYINRDFNPPYFLFLLNFHVYLKSFEIFILSDILNFASYSCGAR